MNSKRQERLANPRMIVVTQVAAHQANFLG